MTELRPLRAEDYVKAVGPVSHIDVWEAARLVSRRGVGFSGWVDDRLAGCAGLLPLWPGVAEAWLAPTALGRAYPVFLCRSVRNVLRMAVRDWGLWRVQADVVADHGAGIAFVERLGFRPESVMRRYGPKGEDFLRYAMFPGEGA
jgi:RimJ/RimL family protein N-acetyltransferase